MSEENTSQENEQVDQVSNEQEQEQKHVDYNTYERTKNDMHKFKRQFMEQQTKLEKMQAELEKAETEKLKNSENYKELWEKERQAKEDLKGKLSQFSSTVLEDKRRDAIKQELLKNNFDTDFLDIVDAFDTSDVLVETTSNGSFVVNGADTWVEALKSTKPKMFKQKVDPKVNNATGDHQHREKIYSKQDVLKLQKENPKLYEEIIKTKRHLIR